MMNYGLMRQIVMCVCVFPGYYLYADGSVGEWGNKVMLYSEVFQPITGGRCVTFWYHMHGLHIGTLNLYRNNKYALRKLLKTLHWKAQHWLFVGCLEDFSRKG